MGGVLDWLSEVPPGHPRAESLRWRHRLLEGHRSGVVAPAGLIAHGRGEAFDYLLGERTQPFALEATKAAAAALLLAKLPVISVNGNVAALVAREVVDLARLTSAKVEVNLFYRSLEREQAIESTLREAGSSEVLGVGNSASAVLPGVHSERRRVDPRGILAADVVLVPLEDGDRAEALAKLGKTVVAIDLNPLSRTARAASITIVDNVVRALPNLIREVGAFRKAREAHLKATLNSYDNKKTLAEALAFLSRRLLELAGQSVFSR